MASREKGSVSLALEKRLATLLFLALPDFRDRPYDHQYCGSSPGAFAGGRSRQKGRSKMLKHLSLVNVGPASSMTMRLPAV